MTIAHLAHPILLTGALALATLGLAVNVPAAAIVATLSVLVALVVIVAERRWPFRADWCRDHHDTEADGIHLVVSLALAEGCMRGLGLWLGARATPSLALWPHTWPRALQVAAALFVVELGTYLGHRALHAVPWLWRFHRIHHSAPRLYWLNTARNHPIDVLVATLSSTVPLVLMGAPSEVLALVSVFVTTHLLVQHSNIALAPGPFDLVLATAPMHRFHHDRAQHKKAVNYGHVLSLWDVLFRTWQDPRRAPAPETIGIADGPAVPSTWWGQVLLPFSRRKVRDLDVRLPTTNQDPIV